MYHKVHKYLLKVTPERNGVLQEMERFAKKNDFPIIGPLVGRYLYQMAITVKAKNILELGSGYGYSGIWFAMALGKKGHLVMTDHRHQNRDRALEFFQRSGLQTDIDFRVGDALKIASRMMGPFDIILNDIDKKDYPRTIELAASRLRKGGLFLTDNVIWSGKVADKHQDETTQRIVEFTQKLYEDPRFFTTVLPIRDGLAVSVRL